MADKNFIVKNGLTVGGAEIVNSSGALTQSLITTVPSGAAATTQSVGNSSTALATTAYVRGEIDALIDSAPGTLNTLDELAAAINDDAAFNTTLTNAVALKSPLASPTFTGTVTTSALTANGAITLNGYLETDNSHSYFGNDSTSAASLTLRKKASGADVIDYLQLRNTANTLIGKIAGDGDITFVDGTFSGTVQGTRLGLGVAAHATAGLNITTSSTNQHIRLNHGSELGIISLLSGGELDLWGHGDGETINFRTGTGSGAVAMNIVGTKVGIGETDPKGWLHIKEGDSGLSGSVNSNFDQLVLEDDSHCGMTILSSTGGDGAIYFGDSGGNNRGQFKYKHGDDSFGFITADGANYALQLKSDDNAVFAGNISLTGGGTIEAPSSSGSENLTLKAAGGITVVIDSNGNSGDNQFFKVQKHTNTDLFTVQETGAAIFGGNVGIGGITPGSRLEVRAAANGTSLAEFSGTDGRGLKIFTQKSDYPTNSGQNDAAVVYNAQDTENAAYPRHIFQTGGTERMRIQSTGVGIGTTNPVEKLHLGGTAPGDSIIRQDATSSGTNWEIGERTAGKYQFWEDDGDNVRLTIMSSGNVGIGTESPSCALEVVDSSANQPGTAFKVYSTQNSAATDGLVFIHSDQSLAPFTALNVRQDGTGDLINGLGGTTDRFMVDNCGALSIYGTGTQNASNDGKIYVEKNNNADWSIKCIAGADDYGIMTKGNGTYAIAVYNHNASNYRARIHYDGYIYSSDGSIHDIDSDVRLKEEIVAAPSQWQMIKDLPLQKFKWKDRRHGDVDSYGWIAQVVQENYSEFVEPIPQTKEAIDAGEEDPEYLTVKTGDITRRAIAALQEAMTRIETLEAEVAALKG